MRLYSRLTMIEKEIVYDKIFLEINAYNIQNINL